MGKKEEINKDIEFIEEDEILTLTDDKGQDVDFYILAELDFKGKWYIFLEAANPDEEFKEGEVLIYEMGIDEEGGELYLPIEDEKLLEEVFQMFLDEMKKIQSE